MDRTRDLDAKGQLLNTSKIEEKCKLGDMVERKDGHSGTIKVMTPFHVIVTLSDNKDYQVSADELLGGDWKLRKEVKPRVPLDKPFKYIEDMEKEHLKSQIQFKVCEEFKKHGKHAKLDIWSKQKGVTVAEAFAKGKLIIPCYTNKIEIHMVNDGRQQPASSFLYGEEKLNG